MENNNTPRKADLHYDGWKIPIVVLAEDNNIYTTKLDPSRFPEHLPQTARTDMRNAYVDVCCDYVGWGRKVADFNAESLSLGLIKDQGNYALVFVDNKPVQEEGEPIEMNESDNVVPFPKVAKLTELDRQLNLMAHLNYEVKSWDISFPEDGEPQLFATFTKVEAGHPF